MIIFLNERKIEINREMFVIGDLDRLTRYDGHVVVWKIIIYVGSLKFRIVLMHARR